MILSLKIGEGIKNRKKKNIPLFPQVTRHLLDKTILLKTILKTIKVAFIVGNFYRTNGM